MKKFYVALMLWVGVAGCGYTTHAYIAQTGFKTVYVRPFANKVDTTSEFSQGNRFKTYFPLLENNVTNAIVDRFMFDGSLKSAKEAEADLRVEGELTSYRRDTIRASTADVPEEYRVTVFVNVKLLDNKTQAVIWEKRELAGEATFFITGPFVKSESQAVSEAVTDLARRIVDTTVEAW